MSASAEQFGPVEVTALPSLNGGGIGGYNERRFSITNPTADAHEVRLTVNSPGYGVRTEMHVNRTFVSPARSTIEVAVDELIIGWAPPREVTVAVDGRTRSPALKLAGAGSGRPSTQVLLSPSFGDSKLRAEVAKRASDAYQFEYTRTEVPPSQWSTNWLAYSSYGAIAVTPGDWNEIPAAGQAAVLRWVRAGGLLLVTGGSIAAPDAFPLQTANEYTTLGHGFGTIINVPGALEDAPQTLFNGFIIACDRHNAITHVDEAPMAAMPLLGPSKVPVGLMFSVLLTFAILGGPLSLFWLARRDRRLWIFWTLPAFATLTSLVLIGTSLAGEGWQRVYRSTSITFLDENLAEATTLGVSGVYCTLPPDGAVRFSFETEIRPYDKSNRVEEIDANDGQRLASGWIDSRVSTYFALRRNEHRRERLSLEKEGGSIRAVNGFGSRIVQLWVADADGKIYQAGVVEPGAPVTLKQAGMQITTPAVDLFPGPVESWPSWSERLRNDPRPMLRPGMYVAVLQSSPFLETALDHPSTQSMPGVVAGVAKWSRRDAF